MSEIPWKTIFKQITAIAMMAFIADLTVKFNNQSLMWWFVVPALVAIAEPDGKDGEENDRTTSK